MTNEEFWGTMSAKEKAKFQAAWDRMVKMENDYIDRQAAKAAAKAAKKAK